MDKKRFAQLALFIIYAGFGTLKVFGLSPATPLVTSLLAMTMPFIDPDIFLILFGLFEVLIGILFLFPKYKKITVVLFIVHMICVFMPLILLPHVAWSGFLIPTLEGQYIIKNLALIALVMFL
jgi:hypothetical protein